MNISTKTGDCGCTSLLYGRRVKKDSLRIEACGALDELNSFLGLCKNSLKDRASKEIIIKVQNNIFIIGSEVACSGRDSFKLRKKTGKNDTKALEAFIERLEKRQGVRKFILPGSNAISAYFDIARTVARRAERRIVTLSNKGQIKNKTILIYLNRLSDLLFLMARSSEKK